MSEIECSFYDGICKSPINKSNLECSLIPVERCYYKQLQQQKQENKRLRKELQGIKELLGSCESELLELKAHCRGVSPLHTMVEKEIKRLRTENETLNTLFKNYKKEYINSTNKLGEMVLKNGNLYNEKEKYKQCLDEIEEIVKKYSPLCPLIVATPLYEIDNILQKIKEVKGE